MHRMSLSSLHTLSLLLLLAVPYAVWSQSGQGSALPLFQRSVTISTSIPSAIASHTFKFKFNSSAPIGSIMFEYCDNLPQIIGSPCAPAPGVSLSAAILSLQSGNTGFTIDRVNSTNTRIVLTRAATPPVTALESSYTFDNVINPSGQNDSTYVRITSYGTPDATGSYIDYGTAAFSTTLGVYSVNTFVPPYLNLCVGVSVALDCSQTEGDSLDLGVLSSRAPRTATSQFAAATNDVSGYNLHILGTTMTSGNNVIPSVIGAPGTSAGTSAFGINLRRNSSPSVGEEPAGVGTAAPAGGYANPNLFSFIDGSMIANSPLSTDYNRMTVSYVVNVSGNQPPGIYSTTLTYLASVQF
jgi:hypothetical protein